MPKTGFPENMKKYRDFIAQHYLRGRGIEIGAGPYPISLDPEKTEVKYVDYASIEKIKVIYPDINESYAVPDIVDDGATLKKIPDAALNFIVSCHMLED